MKEADELTAKKHLQDACARLRKVLGRTIRPQFSSEARSGLARTKWATTLKLPLLRDMVFTASGDRREKAERKAAYRAVKKLKKLGLVNKDLEPIPDAVLAQTENENEDSLPPLDDANTPPRVLLHNIYQTICHILQDKDLKPKLTMKRTADEQWKAEICVQWPSDYSVESQGRNKDQAETQASHKLVQWLKETRAVDRYNNPIPNSREQVEEFRNLQWSPPYVELSAKVIKRSTELITKCKLLKAKVDREETNEDDVTTAMQAGNVDGDIEAMDGSMTGQEEGVGNANPALQVKSKIDPITGKQYKPLGPKQSQGRSQEMNAAFIKQKKDRSALAVKIREIREQLPITSHRRAILKAIKENNVLVIAGDTGCGKTTQCPQFILDEAILNLKGAECNIIVTQPRRISAVAMAERVAEERGEQLGESVGYKIRLDKQTVSKKGAILFCSTGILLRFIESNPRLDGVSHVIVDEAHERDILIDFLLVLLSGVSQIRPDLKIIIMSATLNENLLADYLGGCRVYRVPGLLYPVTDFYLPDIAPMLGLPTSDGPTEGFNAEVPLLQRADYDLIVRLIAEIDSTKPPGAILCFLPGWQEIRTVHDRLKSELKSGGNLIYPLHSRLTLHSQVRIFQAPPPGVRKIILATNVAETSITVDDVVYVIDPGRHREVNYNPDKGISSIGVHWVSQANVIQRRGRAGRTGPGECYHLYTKDEELMLNKFPLPEIQRTPLEKVVLDTKLYQPNCNTVQFLSQVPEPPSSEAVERAVVDLRDLGVLDSNERLTPLGRTIVSFPLHPRLSKSLVYSVLLGCVGPVLNICALSSAQCDMFLVDMENKSVRGDQKEAYAYNTGSDHQALANLYKAWQDAEVDNQDSFCTENHVNPVSMGFFEGLCHLLANHLVECSLVETTKAWLDVDQSCNVYAGSPEMVKAALLAGMYPNILRVIYGDVYRNRIQLHLRCYNTLEGNRAMLQRESVNYRAKDLDADWLMYFHRMTSEEQGEDLVRDTSVVSSMALLLMGGTSLEIVELDSPDSVHLGSEEVADPVLMVLDQSDITQFVASRKVAEVIVGLRESLLWLLDWNIRNWKRMSYDSAIANAKPYRMFQKAAEILALALENEASSKNAWRNDPDMIQRFLPSFVTGGQ